MGHESATCKREHTHTAASLERAFNTQRQHARCCVLTISRRTAQEGERMISIILYFCTFKTCFLRRFCSAFLMISHICISYIIASFFQGRSAVFCHDGYFSASEDGLGVRPK